MTCRDRRFSIPVLFVVTLLAGGIFFESTAAAQGGSRGSQDLYTLIEQAQAHVVAGRWNSAINVYLDAWKVSRDPGYLYNIAVLYLVRLRDEARALDYAEKYSEQARNDSEKMEAEGLMRRIRNSIKGTHGRIVVDVQPTSAESVIYVDGQPLGEENWITAGTHTLSVQASGYVPFSRDIDVVAGVETSYSVVMKTIEGQVAVRCLGGGCRVIIDGDKIGQAPVQKTLSPGEHSVEIIYSGKNLFSDWVVVESGMQSTVLVSVDTGRTEVTTDNLGAVSGLEVVLNDGSDKDDTEEKVEDNSWATDMGKQPTKARKLGHQKAAAVSMWVISALSLGTGTAMYFLGQDKLDSAGSMKPTDYPSYAWYEWEFDNRISDGELYSYVAYGSWGLSGAALAIGLALWFTAPADSPVAVLPSGPEGPGATVLVRW